MSLLEIERVFKDTTVPQLLADLGSITVPQKALHKARNVMHTYKSARIQHLTKLWDQQDTESPPPPLEHWKCEKISTPKTMEWCDMCGEVIQSFHNGEGTPRYHCLDCYGTVCVVCHSIQHKVFVEMNIPWTAVEAKWAPHSTHMKVLETTLLHNMVQYAHAAPTISDRIRRVLEQYATRPCLGFLEEGCEGFQRYGDILPTCPREYKVQWLSFDDVRRRVICMQQKLLQFEAGGDVNAVGICIRHPALWHVVEMAVVCSGFTSVGLYQSWSVEDIQKCLQAASLKVVFLEEADTLTSTFPPSVHVITVSFQNDMFTCPALTQPNQELVCSPVDPAFAFVSFTSGTSGGAPKGIRFPPADLIDETYTGDPTVTVGGWAPAWVSDKRHHWDTTLKGGRIGFLRSSTQNMFDGYCTYRPCPSDSMVPVVAEELMRLFQHAIESNSNVDISNPKALAKQYVFALDFLYQTCLGGRLKMLTLGGAHIRPELRTFLQDVLPCFVMETYASTEAGNVLVEGRVREKTIVKLVSRPELGYTMEDKPFPRGEMAVFSNDVVERQRWLLCDESQHDQINARYTADGYLLTGDIAEHNVWKNTYKLIDRVSEVIKLANGIFFSPTRVEEAIMTSLGKEVLNCFVCADVTMTYPVALLQVRVLDVGDTEVWTRKVQAACHHAGVRADHVPAIVVPTAEPWTVENQLLTNNGKVNRTILKKKLHEKIKESSSSVQLQKGTRDVEAKPPLPRNELIQRIMRVFFPSGETITTTQPFQALGVTSLQFLSARGLLTKMMANIMSEYTVPMSWYDIVGNDGATYLQFDVPILSQHSLESLAQVLLFADSVPVPPSSKVVSASKVVESQETSPPKPELLPKSQTSLADKILACEASIAQAVAEMEESQTKVSSTTGVMKDDGTVVVFLTGSVGFLGRHVLRNLLENEEAPMKIICLVRSTKTESPSDRVISALRRVNVSQDVLQQYESNVQVLDGDISLPRFGLSEEVHHQNLLLSGITHIVHAAAMVKSWSLEQGFDTLS
eukprot:PhF_6_TR31872/c0_g1_i2/m.47314